MIYGIVAVILSVSSAAPVRTDRTAGPSLGTADLLASAIYALTWVPFIAVLLWVARAAGAWRGAAQMGALLGATLLAPAAHTATFLAIDAWVAGRPVNAAITSSRLAFQVLTLLGTLQFMVLIAVLVAAMAAREANESRLRAAELELSGARLEAQIARARIDALSAQLRPHFLFNTLNSISVLAESDARAAQLMVRRLSALLRAILTEGDRPTVTLGREVELLDAYVEIQRVRFGERLRVSIDVDDAVRTAEVPTLVLQPLVENAIHYAVSESEHGGTISIVARRNEDRLNMVVTDDGSGGDPAAMAGAHWTACLRKDAGLAIATPATGCNNCSATHMISA